MTPAAAVRRPRDAGSHAAARRLPAPVAGDGGLRARLSRSRCCRSSTSSCCSPSGSAHDPAGKEGLAALTAAMIADAGSRAMTIDQIDAVLYPMAGSFAGRADKEMTTFTGIIHRDHWHEFLATVLPQLLDPGFRDEDFKRLKDAQLNALVQDLRSNNEEELGQGAAADEHLPRHAVRPRRARHGRGPQRHHAGRREAVREDDVHARRI